MEFIREFSSFIVENPVSWIVFIVLLVVAIFISSYWNYGESLTEDKEREEKQDSFAQVHWGQDDGTRDEMLRLVYKISEADFDKQLDDLLSETLRPA